MTDSHDVSRMNSYLGIYTISNTGSVLIHEINADTVLDSINGVDPSYYTIVNGEGFFMGEWWIPFSECMSCN